MMPSAPDSFLRTIYSVYFTLLPGFGFVEWLDIVGGIMNAIVKAFGSPIGIVGF